ncbi:sialate O-acetylesterase [Winogradskyella bathintestinalis]|uniref:Sialate O-acetylesterase n=1 Tax=Winogradskyella bathintestinalis TaxID=3035208 RepID=A0ABT7ZV93_9FLAO|nr:sialate O-acetylesterase [Winogradskyella bathintestinalis]MDN3492729.1 sialate O-acetylesterase [Winogradskyella bathintestinalis]
MKHLLSILLLNLCLFSFGQVTFNTVPINKQLVARDLTTNLGTVTVAGNVNSSGINYDAIQVVILRNNVAYSSVTEPLNYSGNTAAFNIDATIASELANYTITINGITAGNPTPIRQASEVVAGDVFIVQGQSNAEANSRNGSANANQSPFLRVYASGTENGGNLQNNDNWFYAEGDRHKDIDGNAGQWGLKLARMLMDDLQIPIAIFNGAHGGQPIEFFQAPNDYSTSTASNYGRMYYRLNKTGLKNNVRAILWSQGEANSFGTGLATQSYVNLFNDLKADWLNDYPNIEHFYMFQTRDCDCGTTSGGRLKIKEAQRLLALNDATISIMPTTGMTLHNDNCHYPYINGYEKFANRIYPLVKRDIYGESFPSNIDAPMVISAKLMSPTSLEIETDMPLQLNTTDNVTLLNRIQQDYTLRNVGSATITAAQVSGNKIIFTLSTYPGYGRSSTISFIGKNSGSTFNITNTNELELVNFSFFPIEDLSDNGNPPDGGNPSGNGSDNTNPKILQLENGGQIFVKANASLNLKGLRLTPSVDFTLDNNNIATRSLTAIGTAPNESMARVFNFASATSGFTGTIRYYYDDVDLGNITHEDAVLQIKDDTDTWSSYTDEDSNNNKVTYTFSNPIQLKSVTASASATTLSVDTLTEEMNINIYPNPVKSIINLDYNGDLKTKMFDFSGRLLLETESKTIDMSTMPTGVYVLQTTETTTNKQNSYKVIKK